MNHKPLIVRRESSDARLRAAVSSDAHGNAFALEAVLDDIRNSSPDLDLNLGDQVTGRADPHRAYPGRSNTVSGAAPRLRR